MVGKLPGFEFSVLCDIFVIAQHQRTNRPTEQTVKFCVMCPTGSSSSRIATAAAVIWLHYESWFHLMLAFIELLADTHTPTHSMWSNAGGDKSRGWSHLIIGHWDWNLVGMESINLVCITLNVKIKVQFFTLLMGSLTLDHANGDKKNKNPLSQMLLTEIFKSACCQSIEINKCKKCK